MRLLFLFLLPTILQADDTQCCGYWLIRLGAISNLERQQYEYQLNDQITDWERWKLQAPLSKEINDIMWDIRYDEILDEAKRNRRTNGN